MIFKNNPTIDYMFDGPEPYEIRRSDYMRTHYRSAMAEAVDLLAERHGARWETLPTVSVKWRTVGSRTVFCHLDAAGFVDHYEVADDRKEPF
jgi:hypothetical protein